MSHAMQKQNLARSLLEGLVDKTFFEKHPGLKSSVDAVYFCHPAQTFDNLDMDKTLQQNFSKVTKIKRLVLLHLGESCET